MSNLKSILEFLSEIEMEVGTDSALYDCLLSVT